MQIVRVGLHDRSPSFMSTHSPSNPGVSLSEVFRPYITLGEKQ